MSLDGLGAVQSLVAMTGQVQDKRALAALVARLAVVRRLAIPGRS